MFTPSNGESNGKEDGRRDGNWCYIVVCGGRVPTIMCTIPGVPRKGLLYGIL